jgi:hypothetical protein
VEDVVLLIGFVGALVSAPVGSYLRGLIYRFGRKGRVLVESETGISSTEFGNNESPSAVADRVEKLVEASEHPTLAGQRRTETPARPPRVNITLVEVVYGIALIVGIAAKAAWDYTQEKMSSA